MKAVIQKRYGSADVLSVGEAVTPKTKKNEILVRVYASPVTQGNRQVRAGIFPTVLWLPARLMVGLFRPKNPIPGTVFAGRVESVGSAVTRFSVGDKVFGANLGGAYAEFLNIPEDAAVAKMPEGMSYEEAAASPYGGTTTLIFLQKIAKVQPKERVLIIGASGGIGRFGVQLAKHLGAEVTGVCSKRNFELVRSLGADYVIDYKSEDFTKNGQKYDVIFDTVDSHSFTRARKTLNKNGRYLSVEPSVNLFFWMMVTSLFGNRKAYFKMAIGAHAEMNEIRKLLENRAIWPIVGRQYPLEEIIEAHKAPDTTSPNGCVVVNITS
mgnify:CR=1 FL=1